MLSNLKHWCKSRLNNWMQNSFLDTLASPILSWWNFVRRMKPLFLLYKRCSVTLNCSMQVCNCSSDLWIVLSRFNMLKCRNVNLNFIWEHGMLQAFIPYFSGLQSDYRKSEKGRRMTCLGRFTVKQSRRKDDGFVVRERYITRGDLRVYYQGKGIDSGSAERAPKDKELYDPRD